MGSNETIVGMSVLDLLRTPLVAIDVGTATTRVCFEPARVVERSSVVREDHHGTVVAHSTVRAGVVADIAGVAHVIEELLARRGMWRRRPAAIVCAPTDVSDAERDALIEAVAEAGASVAAVVPEPLAAAIGAGVDIGSEYATAVVDIGEGITDFAVFRSGAIVHSHARRIGCGTLRAALRAGLELHGDEDSPRTDDSIETVVRAYCSGSVRNAYGLSRDEIKTLIEPKIDAIASFIATTFRELPDGMATEVIESGIYVTGGGAKLERLVDRIEEKVGLTLTCSGEPLRAVIRGASKMLRNRQLLSA